MLARFRVSGHFTFAKEHGNAGMAYTVTSTNGNVEGFQMFFPRLTLLYTAVLGGNFQPMRDNQGNALFNVAVEAVGSFGIDGIETMRLDKTNLKLTYPLQDGETKVGAIYATAQGGARFEGDLVAAEKALKLRGVVKDELGRVTFKLDSGVDGGAVLQPFAQQEATASAVDL